VGFFYVASRLEDRDRALGFIERLEKEGHRCTLAWPRMPRVHTLAELAHRGEEEVQAIGRADVLLMIAPGGRGTHTELGVALGKGIGIVLYTPPGVRLDQPYPCVFHHHRRVRIVDTRDTAIRQVLAHMNHV
jgi:hypothetical protein